MFYVNGSFFNKCHFFFHYTLTWLNQEIAIELHLFYFDCSLSTDKQESISLFQKLYFKNKIIFWQHGLGFLGTPLTTTKAPWEWNPSSTTKAPWEWSPSTTTRSPWDWTSTTTTTSAPWEWKPTETATTNCVHGTYSPHATDCSKYYLCAHQKLIVKSCPYQTAWDQNKKACVLVGPTGCTGGKLKLK